MGAWIAGRLKKWPSKAGMAAILRAAGLTVAVGTYSVHVVGGSRFIFQEYGGDLGDPVIDADSESVSGLLATATLVSEALGCAQVVHRFELYDDDSDALVGSLHYGWPLPGD